MDAKLQETLNQTLEKLEQVSPSFCVAKWKHATLHLHSGLTHSCYHNPPHPVNLDSPNFLATKEKDLHKKQMLKGEKPEACQFCWSIESDQSSKSRSDRIIKSSQSWASPYFDQIQQNPLSENHLPSYLEISFSRKCQMKCVYCGPQYSTAWQSEIEQNGQFKTLIHEYKKISHEEVEQLKIKFWTWADVAIKQLDILRVTGGEPVLSDDFWKLLDRAQELKTDAQISINSNLSWPANIRDRLLNKLAEIKTHRPDIKIKIVTSLEAINEKAELIRKGLNFQFFIENFKVFSAHSSLLDISVTSTVNRLSVNSYYEFLTYFLELRNTQPHLKFVLDPSPLKKPYFLSLGHASSFEINKISQDINKILVQYDPILFDLEKIKLLALNGWLETSRSNRKEVNSNENQYKEFLLELQNRYHAPYVSIFSESQRLAHSRELYE